MSLTLPRQKSIAGRLIAFSIAFVAGAMIVASIILWFIVAGVVREQIDQRLDTQIEGLRSALVAHSDGTAAFTTELDGPPFDRPGSGWYWQITGKDVHLTSRSLADGGLQLRHRPLDWRDLATHRPRADEAEDARGRALYVRTVLAQTGDHALQISVSAPQSALTDPAVRSLMWLTPAMALLGAILLIGTYLQVRFGLKPLNRLTADIGAVLSGKRAELPETDIEELRPVSSEVNRLIALNERRLEETRLQFANMAHGLKTPVASLTLGLSETNDPDGALRVLVQRIDRRIRHHLADARKSAVGDGYVQGTFLRPRLEDLILVLSNIHRDRSISADCYVGVEVSVRCDPEDIDEVFGNLLDNAFKWAKSTVSISAERKGSSVAVTIRDDGAGMPPDQIDEAFRPGLRLDESVPGSGFGLGIAKEIVELYGGTVSLKNVSEGFEAVITLPLAVPSDDALSVEALQYRKH